MKRKIIWMLAVMMAATLAWGAITPVNAAGVVKISKEDAKAKMGAMDVVFIDVRKGSDWKSSEIKIKGAVREDPNQPGAWAKNYDKSKTLILYCA